MNIHTKDDQVLWFRWNQAAGMIEVTTIDNKAAANEQVGGYLTDTIKIRDGKLILSHTEDAQVEPNYIPDIYRPI
jgi:hypothetical protein